MPVQVTQEAWVQSPGREEPLEEGLAARSSIPARGPHEQRSLAGGSPWGRRESDTTEQLNPQDLEGCACLHRSCIVTSLVSLLGDKRGIASVFSFFIKERQSSLLNFFYLARTPIL